MPLSFNAGHNKTLKTNSTLHRDISHLTNSTLHTDISPLNLLLIQPITRRQNLRLIEFETNYREHFKVDLKWKISTI